MDYQSLVSFQGWTFVAQILNLFIQVYLFKRFLFKPIKEILAKRQAEVDELYTDADQAKQEALQAKTDYTAKLTAAQEEAESITRTAVQNAQDRSEQMLRDAKADADAMRTKAEADIEQERKKAVNDMKTEISDLAVTIASKITQKEIREEDHEKLIAQFIEDLGDAS